MSLLPGLLADPKGTVSIEYALIAAIMGVALIGGLPLLTEALQRLFTEAAASLDSLTEHVRGMHRI